MASPNYPPAPGCGGLRQILLRHKKTIAMEKTTKSAKGSALNISQTRLSSDTDAGAAITEGIETPLVSEAAKGNTAPVIQKYDPTKVDNKTFGIDGLAAKLATANPDALPQPLRVSNVPKPLAVDGATYNGVIGSHEPFTYSEDTNGSDAKVKVYAKVKVQGIINNVIQDFEVKVNMANRLPELKDKTLRENMPIRIEVRAYKIYPRNDDGTDDTTKTPNEGFWALAV